jgi:hypothetical protein
MKHPAETTQKCLENLATLSKDHPHLRLGQIIANVMTTDTDFYKEMFYISDDDLRIKLTNFLKRSPA